MLQFIPAERITASRALSHPFFANFIHSNPILPLQSPLDFIPVEDSASTPLPPTAASVVSEDSNGVEVTKEGDEVAAKEEQVEEPEAKEDTEDKEQEKEAKEVIEEKEVAEEKDESKEEEEEEDKSEDSHVQDKENNQSQLEDELDTENIGANEDVEGEEEETY